METHCWAIKVVASMPLLNNQQGLRERTIAESRLHRRPRESPRSTLPVHVFLRVQHSAALQLTAGRCSPSLVLSVHSLSRASFTGDTPQPSLPFTPPPALPSSHEL